MLNQYPRHLPHRQRGAVALLLALILLVGFSTYVLKKVNSSEYAQAAASNDKSLSSARDALLGYAMGYANKAAAHPSATPGNLPCPDIDGDGLEDSNSCGAFGESAIGRLPWRTLGLDSNSHTRGGCLWYAVSGSFKSSPDSHALANVTPESLGMFQIENESGDIISGSTAQDRAIAVVFRPGQAVMVDGNMQQRTPSGAPTQCGAGSTSSQVNQAAQYLDQLGGISNASGRKSGAAGSDPGASSLPTNRPSVFVNAGRSNTADTTVFNDQMLWITPTMYQPVFEQLNRWIMRRVRQCVLDYGSNNMIGLVRSYPFAAQLNDSAMPNYSQVSPMRFGRIPALSTAPQWPNDSFASSTQCFSWPWWSHWREQIFYAVHKDHTINASLNLGGTLQLDGTHSEFVLLLADKPLAAQARALYLAKGHIENYLEEDNIPETGSAMIPTGDENFISSGSAAFNDKACSELDCFF